MAKGRGRGSKKASAKAKAGGSSRSMSTAQQALQKIRENCKPLSDHARFVKVLESTGRTLKEQVEHDIVAKRHGDRMIAFGPNYYNARMKEYADDETVFSLLRPDPADESVVNTELMSATLFLCIFLLRFCCCCCIVRF